MPCMSTEINNFFKILLDIIRKILLPKAIQSCYTIQATTSRLVQKGGVPVERSFIIFTLCHGICSCLLHLQMAGRRFVSGSQPEV